MPDMGENNRLTITTSGVIWMSERGQEPIAIRYSVPLGSNQYPTKRYETVSDPAPIPGMSSRVRWLLVSNCTGENISHNLSDEEREQLAKRVLVIATESGTPILELTPCDKRDTPEGVTVLLPLSPGAEITWQAKDAAWPVQAEVMLIEG